MTVCEDMWQPGPPATDLALAGAQLLVNISASPFHVGKDREREEMFRTRARDNNAYVAFCNTVGGQDELIFDGHSVVIDDEGEVIARAPGFEEALLVVDVDLVERRRAPAHATRAAARSREDRGDLGAVSDDPRRRAARAGRRRRADGRRRSRTSSSRCGRRSCSACATTCGRTASREVVVGVSGGIDSALTAALAVEALGADRVHCVSMPSRYSSEGTRTDARRLAESARLRLPRDPDRADGRGVRAPRSRRRSPGREPDLTEENLQARIRGTLLMALSNKFGWLLVATGNKSELSVGYATLYGDMAGGFALLKDVFKTDVFRLARHLNERAGRELIPQSIIDRAAERRAARRPARRGLAAAVPGSSTRCSRRTSSRTARSRSCRRTASTRDVVERAVAMIDRAEYKRRQAPPGVQAPPEGVRPRPPHADHQPLAVLARSATRFGLLSVPASRERTRAEPASSWALGGWSCCVGGGGLRPSPPA